MVECFEQVLYVHNYIVLSFAYHSLCACVYLFDV